MKIQIHVTNYCTYGIIVLIVHNNYYGAQNYLLTIREVLLFCRGLQSEYTHQKP